MGIVSDKEGIVQLAEVFHNQGVKYIVFSPGSRNAPLVITFANDERFKTFVIPDERSAAFYALGLAEQSKSPVAVMCTSGSALLNYYPAVSEAYYRNIPLVVVSADRPSEWVDQGDGQTIRQHNVFANHICHYTELFENPSSDNQKWFNERTVIESLHKAKRANGGPVHINIPLNEPLYGQGKKEGEWDAFAEIMDLGAQLSPEQIKELREIWNSSKKKLILCGQMPKNGRLNAQLRDLATDKGIAVVVENTSNLQDRNFVHCIDRTIETFLKDNPEMYQPDLLITIGGAVISKKIKTYFRTHQPRHHWRVGHDFPYMDTYQSLTKSIPMLEVDFFDTVMEESFAKDISRYGEQWKQLDYLVRGEHENFMYGVPYSDLSVFNLVLDAVPDSSNLHISNSSTIRYTQLFDPIKSVAYFCNRGTSGIDGSVSTALGNTLASTDKLNVLITGDLSFFYDSNALWNHHLPSNFRIFLINNGGGGIFDIIPGPKTTPNVDDYFVAQHDFSAEHIAKAFNVNYFKADSMESIDSQLNEFLEVYDNDRPGIMEIFTDREVNAKVLADYFKAIKVEGVPVLGN